MNWKMIFGLSLFGLGMAFGTVFVIPPSIEPVCWIAIFVICAFVIARNAPQRAFLHGFLLGIVNSVWVTGAHLLFFSRYLANHPQEATMMTSAQARLPGKALMAIVGPVIGLISGAVIGVLAYIAVRILASRSRAAGAKSRKARGSF